MQIKQLIGIATLALFVSSVPAIALAQFADNPQAPERSHVEEQERHHDEHVAEHKVHRDMQRTAQEQHELEKQHQREEHARHEHQKHHELY